MQMTLKYILLSKYNLLMKILLMFSILMCFNGNSFYFMWIFMEMNMIIFLTYLIMNNEYISVISMKYYLMSSFSSIIFMFYMNMNLYLNYNYIIMILNMMMMFKLGLFPFHFWFIDMMINMNWWMCFLLSTIQKIIPFLILSYMYMLNFILCLILLGVLNFMMVFDNTLLKKIMSYSSINHMYWMLISLIIKFNLWLMYFINYMFISGGLFYLYNKLNLIEIKDFYLIYMNKMFNYLFLYMIFSLGGLPPFYGFILKWYMIYFLINLLMIFVVFMLIIYSLIFLWFYMRLIFNIMMLENMKFNYMIMQNQYFNINLIYMIILWSSLSLIIFTFWILY